jgi:Homeodomain-like domain-containing protein
MSHPITAITPQNITKVLELAASGHTQPAIAKALGISVRSVQRILADPLAKQALADLRLVLRVQALQGAQAIVPDAQTWLAEVVKAKTSAKDADALSRALLNLEKVAASASGENRPLTQPAQQVQVLVAPGWVKGPWQGQAKVVEATPKPYALPSPPDDL